MELENIFLSNLHIDVIEVSDEPLGKIEQLII